MVASVDAPNAKLQRPPGPRAPWFGFPLLLALKADYLGFTSALRARHGDITYMRLGYEHAYDLFTPELARAALVDNAASLVRWQRGIEVFEQIFGQSVLVTEGATWQRQRRMLQPAFTPRRVAGYATLMVDAAQAALDAAVPPGQAQADVGMDALFTGVAMDVIMRTLFSSQAADDARQAAEATQLLSAVSMREMFLPMTLPDWLPLPGKAAKRRAMRCLRQLVGRHIQARRAATAAAPAQTGHAADPVGSTAPGAEAPADLLAMLLALRDEDTGVALTEAEVFDQCMVTFQAGHETSATALLWWSRLMAEHPDAARRAADEVDAVLAGRPPAANDLAALPWLTATLKEAMRLYPPVAALMTRRTTAPITLDGWHVPTGSLLRITPYMLQRDPRWFDQPQAFRPERFLPDAPPLPRGAWMPFGAGPRVCIGQHFAMTEMVLVAALLLQRYRLVLPADAQPCVLQVHVTLRPRDGVRLRLERRGHNGHRQAVPGTAAAMSGSLAGP